MRKFVYLQVDKSIVVKANALLFGFLEVVAHVCSDVADGSELSQVHTPFFIPSPAIQRMSRQQGEDEPNKFNPKCKDPEVERLLPTLLHEVPCSSARFDQLLC
eukprot:738348-Hanusia_phi.AAC.4